MAGLWLDGISEKPIKSRVVMTLLSCYERRGEKNYLAGIYGISVPHHPSLSDSACVLAFGFL